MTTPANAGESDSWPSFSPDGRSVAFVRTASTATGVYRVPVFGGEAIRVVNSGRPLRGVVWSPDGKFLLFATGRHGRGLFVVSSLARDATRMDRVDVAGFDVSEPSLIAKDGGQAMDLAFGHESTDYDIWGSPIGEPATAPDPLAASTRVDQAPNFSPDGAFLAFSSARSGYEEIWVAKANGSDARQLTNLKSQVANSPRWSPDGKWIVFR